MTMGKSNNSYLERSREKQERKREKEKKLKRLYDSIANTCNEICSASYNLKAVDGEDETNIIRSCRRIDDYISDIRRMYKEAEKIKYSDDE